jgi:hypothetical protein
VHPLGRSGGDYFALARLGRLRGTRQRGLSREGALSVDHRRGEAIALPDHGFHVTRCLRVIVQRNADLSNGRIDALIDVNENGIAPKPVRDLFARNQFSAFVYQQEEQLHRLFFEAKDAFAPLQPIPRLVKCEIPEMEYLARNLPPQSLVPRWLQSCDINA